MIKKLLCFSCGIALTLLTSNQASAQTIVDPQLKVIPAPQEPLVKSRTKLSAPLRKLYENYAAANNSAIARTKPVIPESGDMPLQKYMLIKGDKILVDVTVDEFNATTRAKLEKMGMTINASFGRVVSGMIPIASLPALESATIIRFVKPSLRRRRGNIQSSMFGANDVKALPTPVITQGDTALRTYLARKMYNVNGAGVKVGILSDSYNNLGTADIGVKNGELPGPENPFGFKKPVQVLLDLDDSSGEDEGRGMAEIVHDVAPGAELAFYTAYIGEASFADGIIQLAKSGCKVIVDDIGYLTEPFYQDGIISQAVDLVKKAGVTYFSAAGNEGANTYESDYRPSTATPLGAANGTAHNFSAPGTAARYLQPIYIPTGGTFVTAFQWDEPSYSAGGDANTVDLDIYLLNSSGQVVSGSADDNLASGDPVEYFGYTNRSRSTVFYIVILNYAGTNPTRVKCVNFLDYDDALYPSTIPAIPGTSGPTIYGHPNAAGAIATGAAYYLETPAYGLDTAKVEFYSSIGGTGILFNRKGKRAFTPLRMKPEFVSVDGGNTSFFPPGQGNDTKGDRDTFPNFFGTSAAAPHAAAVAALMIEAQKLGTLSPDQIKGIMSTNTQDMDSPYFPGFDKGFDFATGYGFLKGDAAVGAVKYPTIYIKDLSVKAACSDHPNIIRQWVVTNPNPFEVEVRWIINGFAEQGTFMAPPGESTFSSQTRPLANIAIIDWYDNLQTPHFDYAGSTTAKCGADIISEANTDKVSDMVTGAEMADNTGAVSVYPNPISNSFRVSLSLNSQQNTDLSLFTLDGKLLLKKVVSSSGVIDIDASHYAPGMYILKVQQKNFSKTFKLVKK